MALSKFNFNSFDLTTVASTGLAFNSSANGFDTVAAGALNLIATNTISSGVSSSSFTSGIDSTYDTYLFKFINLHPATDATYFTFQGGASYNTTITSTFFTAYHGENGTGANFSYDSPFDQAQGTSYQPLYGQIGSDNDQSCSGHLFVFSPSSTTFVKHFISCMNGSSSGDFTRNDFVAGYFNTTSALTQFQFKFNSGNIDNGVIKMYGITK